jgi:hypothetical protein
MTNYGSWIERYEDAFASSTDRERDRNVRIGSIDRIEFKDVEIPYLTSRKGIDF